MASNVEQAPSDGATCPTCGETFKNRHGMRIHHATAHDESLVEREATTCEHCGTSFTPTASGKGRYCSRDCWHAAATNRVDLTCAACGDTFEVKGHKVDDRAYCSRECYWDDQRETETITCNGCGRTITVSTTHEIEHCSRACMAEDRTSAPRPADLDGVLWVLYVYEDHNARETWLRANAARSDDAEWLTEDDVKQRLRENDWMAGGSRPKYADLTIEDVGLSRDEDASDERWQKFYRQGGESA